MPLLLFSKAKEAISTEEVVGLLVFFGILGAGIATAFILTAIFRSRAMRRALWHKSPFAEAGGEGPLTDLAPVEAGIVLSADISRLLAMYILDLAVCEDVIIVDDAPLKVQVTAQSDLPDFSSRFLQAVQDDGSLDASIMLASLDHLYSDLAKQILPYSVRDSVIHYLNRVDSLWDQIQEERVTSARLDTLEDNLPWLLLHEDAADRLEQMFKTSARWPTVQPVVRKMRVVRSRIVDNQDILEHAANHPEGIFSNKSYRDGIVYWAKEFISRSWSAEIWSPLPVGHLISEEEAALIEQKRKEMKTKLDRMQHCIDIIEGHDNP